MIHEPALAIVKVDKLYVPTVPEPGTHVRILLAGVALGEPDKHGCTKVLAVDWELEPRCHCGRPV